jgi:hypothetical protein
MSAQSMHSDVEESRSRPCQRVFRIETVNPGNGWTSLSQAIALHEALCLASQINPGWKPRIMFPALRDVPA